MNTESPTDPAQNHVPAPVATAIGAEPAAGRSFRRSKVALMVCGVAAIALGIGGAGIAVGITLAPTTTTATSESITASGPQAYAQPGIYQGPGSRSTETTTDTSTDATAATAAQQVGVVTIVSSLYYSDDSQAAGTGIILSSTGEILTNNHVVEGATTIEVTVESTGETYTADVVGTDATADVALLQLEDASGLTPAAIDDSSSVAVADAVTAIGNAEGTGDLVAAAGTVTALDESIQVANEYTGAEESLAGLIEVDADVVSGDSGGPLVDADGEVIGITTAASSGSTNISGYAIEIDTALDIVDAIQAGEASDTVVIGTPAFLGVTLTDSTAVAGGTGSSATSADGVVLGGVVDGLPADEAGLVAGDTITKVDGEKVATADALSAAIAAHEPGDQVKLTYVDASGDKHTATVTLAEGPAA